MTRYCGSITLTDAGISTGRASTGCQARATWLADLVGPIAGAVGAGRADLWWHGAVADCTIGTLTVVSVRATAL